jgi:hypothetical protein
LDDRVEFEHVRLITLSAGLLVSHLHGKCDLRSYAGFAVTYSRAAVPVEVFQLAFCKQQANLEERSDGTVASQSDRDAARMLV